MPREFPLITLSVVDTLMARIEGDAQQRKQCKANFPDAEVMIMIEDIGRERVTTMSRFQTSMLNSVRSQMKT